MKIALVNWLQSLRFLITLQGWSANLDSPFEVKKVEHINKFPSKGFLEQLYFEDNLNIVNKEV